MRIRQGIRLSGLIVLGAGAILLAAGIFNLGGDDSLSFFLFLQVALLVWFFSRRAAASFSLSAVGLWLAASLLRGFSEVDPLALYMHAALRCVLCACVIVAMAAIQDALKRERELARTDALTGLANARWFGELANGEIRRAQRYHHPFSVAYIDLDNFKTINDRFGHTVGDAVLRAVAQAIKSNIRVVDVVSRLGGDEFVVVLPETGADAALIAMHKLQGILLDVMERSRWPVTFSIGLTTFQRPPASVQQMIEEADALMYEGKRSAKNMIRYERWDGERTASAGPAGRHVQAPVEPASLQEDWQQLWIDVPLWLRRAAHSPAVYAVTGLALVTLLSLIPIYLLLDSLPSTPFYPFKRGLEQLQLSFATDAAARARVHLSLSDRRLDEMSMLLRSGHDDLARLTAPAYDGEVVAMLTVIQAEPDAIPLELLQQVGEHLVNQQNTLRDWQAQLPAPERAVVEQSLSDNQAALRQLETVAAAIVTARLNPVPPAASGTAAPAATPTRAVVAVGVVTPMPTGTPVTSQPTATAAEVATAGPGEPAAGTPTLPAPASAVPPDEAPTPTPTLVRAVPPEPEPTLAEVPTPTPEATATVEQAPTREPVPPTPTATEIPSETPTPTFAPTPTATRTPHPPPTEAPTTTATPTRLPTATATATREPTATRVPTATRTPTVTAAPTATTVPTATPTPTTPGRSGPSCAQQLVVPNLIGLSKVQARKAWRTAGFSGNLFAWQADPQRTVESQSLRPGSLQSVCSSITVN